MAETEIPEFVHNWNQAPFFRWPDMKILEAKDGKARLCLHVQKHHRGGGGTKAINGGIISYMFDGLLAAAARSTATEDITAMATLTLNIQYLNLLKAEEKVFGEAEVTRSGKSTVFAKGQLFDDEGEVCATCTGIFRLFYPRN